MLILHTNPSKQLEVLSLQTVQEEGVSITGTSFYRSTTCLGHPIAGYLDHKEISVLPYLGDWLVHNPARQVLCRQSNLLKMLRMVGFNLAKCHQIRTEIS